MARQHGLTEERIAASEDFENQDFADREKAALRFAEQLTVDYRKLNGEIYENLGRHFDLREIAEIAVFSAWQGNGLRVIHSWKAETLWTENRVPLPFTDESSIFGNPQAAKEPFDPRDPKRQMGRAAPSLVAGDAEQKRNRQPRGLPAQATDRGTPPEWISFLSHSPEALEGWSEFFRLVFAEGILDVRLKAAVGAQMARLLGSEVWFESFRERAGREGLDEIGSPRESAALRYGECITTDYLAVDDELFEELRRHFTDPELIELGLFVGMMNGTFRLSQTLGIGGKGSQVAKMTGWRSPLNAGA
ncbi:MAG: carboxymuconolactone decarboxylase family protein [Nitrospinota bacterium]